MVVLFAGVLLIPAGSISATEQSLDQPSESFSPIDPPPLVLEKCIGVQKVIRHNPFSPMPNSFLLVTQYEEKLHVPGAEQEGLKPGKALNMYLVLSVLVPPENQEIGIAQGTGLIVKVSTIDSDSARETIQEWILIDEDGDANVDRGFFRETVNGERENPIRSNEAKFPDDRLKDLQTYYEKAAQTLGSKAETGREEGCVIS
jgi:hypothetical protein